MIISAGLSEATLRLGCFIAVFVIVALLEARIPRRLQSISRSRRWPANFGISALNQVAVRLLLPLSAVALAAHASVNGWGLLNAIAMPGWLAFALALLLLDLTLYLQHRLFHAVPWLWRLHRMHHADTEFDVSTGIRFHPVSILVSACIKLAVVGLLGPAPAAVLVFEVLLNATSLFNHGNLRIPPALDRILRCIVVTPDMHRVHHSVRVHETDSNFGFNFPWWDRWFGTYVAQPQDGHAAMRIGLEAFRESAEQRIDRMLTQPFRSAGPGS